MEPQHILGQGKTVMQFKLEKRIPLEAECVESATDEASGLQCFALLNNQILLMDGEFNIRHRFLHASDKKINRVKFSEGLVCVTGEDQIVSFYDPKSNQAVKKINGRSP